MESTLRKKGQFTFFAPTNTAFQKLDEFVRRKIIEGKRCAKGRMFSSSTIFSLHTMRRLKDICSARYNYTALEVKHFNVTRIFREFNCCLGFGQLLG